MADTAARVQELLDRYATADATAARLLCDDHPADAVAFTVIDADLASVDLTYGDLSERSARFAAALADLGVEPGDHVATLMGKSADLVVALLGIWRRGAVHVPLFTAFAPPAIAFRLGASGAKVVVADGDQMGKLAPGDDIPHDAPWQVIVAGDGDGVGLDFAELVESHSAHDPRGEAVAVGGEGGLVQLFTSGTTGTPKGVPVPVKALASFHAYLEFGLDVREDDVFWNAADPGWAYGLYYALLGPLAAGRRSLLLHAGFSPALTWQVLDTFGVTNFAAAPTVYRSLRADSAPHTRIRLRRASSAGEPLTPDVLAWSREELGVVVRDQYGQTEHGMFVVDAWADGLREDVPERSMGKPLPGWTCAVLRDDNDDIAAPGELGRVAIDVEKSPLVWFTGYVDAPEKTATRFTDDGRWYLTGDAGKIDENGFYFFSSRDDDVIIMAGYRIGPFDVESVLVMHPDVVEAAVVGLPDELRGEVLEAFVVLRDGVDGDDALEADLQRLVKTKFAAHAYPRVVHFVPHLPKTPSGKVQRFLLRQGSKS
ncbi:AMP-binding protein [Rhodococcus sp. HNM0563]|uniref:AMP-binding protein n=1 Tax=unclassified Rhodococcus (in: high G+C Gram-positive bacteria) TaxID=192944 RepID=UPI00146DF9A9|nr:MULTISPECIES: AMP-binding protein [unclassified Rhodococcus (in: high G+C Gram-positive bacteria)]MCK0092088.1 AMP-binding protein [Rhodococcus sp. F64268]NLU63286.1 AMP-binding protein [Rhodococcus sp. HNM0563]